MIPVICNGAVIRSNPVIQVMCIINAFVTAAGFVFCQTSERRHIV
jgi:hypothetical protein